MEIIIGFCIGVTIMGLINIYILDKIKKRVINLSKEIAYGDIEKIRKEAIEFCEERGMYKENWNKTRK
jgi:hypothetical protein